MGGAGSGSNATSSNLISFPNCKNSNVNESYVCQASTSAINGNITWTFSAKTCNWLSLNSSNGQLTGTPTESDFGKCEFTLNAVGNQSSISQTYSITISRKLAGTLDTNVGSSGYRLISATSGDKILYGTIVDNSGRLIIASKESDGKLYLNRFARDSVTPDPSFSAYIPISPFGFLYSSAFLSIDQDDNIYLAVIGQDTNGGKNYTTVRRYSHMDGSLDTTYGTAGVGTVKFYPITLDNIGDAVSGMTCSRIGECYIFGQSASRAAMGILGTNGIKKSDFGNYFGYKLGQDLYVEGKIRPWFSFSALQILSNGTLVTISPYNATTDTEFSFFDPVSVLFGFNPTSGNYDTTFGISGSKAFDFVRNSEDTPLGLEIDSEDNIYIGLLNTVYNFSGNTYKVSINKTNSSPALSSTFTPLVLTYTGYRAGMQYLVDEVNYRIYLATSVLETTSGTDKIYIHAIDSKTGAYVNTFGTNGILQLTPASANNLSYVSSKYLKFDGHGRLIVGMSAYDSNNITSIVFATIK